jgi:hypothetical protein
VLVEQTRAWEEQQRRSAEEEEEEEEEEGEEEEEEEAAAEGKLGGTGHGHGQPSRPKLGPRAKSVGTVGTGTSGQRPSAAGHLIKRMSEGRLGGSKDAVIKKHSLVCAPLRSGRGLDEAAEIASPTGSRGGDLAAGEGSSSSGGGSGSGGGGGGGGGIEVGAMETYQVAYLVEPEMKAECETGILTSLRMQVGSTL